MLIPSTMHVCMHACEYKHVQMRLREAGQLTLAAPRKALPANDPTTIIPHTTGYDHDRPRHRARPQLASHKCRWERCPASFIEIDSLQAHVSTHIRKLVNDYCPHKDCTRPDIPSEKLVVHTTKGSSHPLPWTLADLRPTPAPRLIKPPEPPPFPPHLLEVPSYCLGVIAHPFVPPPPVPAAMRKIANEAGSVSEQKSIRDSSRITRGVSYRPESRFTPFRSRRRIYRIQLS
jgi:hypothetical protein